MQTPTTSKPTLLTQAEVDSLPSGAKVFIKWSGGNGPYCYTVALVQGDRWAKEANFPIDGVGPHPGTQVWLADVEAADALRDLMSELSEQCWCAGWLTGTEFHLWGMVKGASRQWGMDEVSEQDVERLRALSEMAGGWWIWRDDQGEFFMTMAQWLPVYEAFTRSAA